MRLSKPPYRIHHLMILAAIIAGALTTLPPGMNCFFATMSLIAFLVIPTFRPETIADWLVYIPALAIIEAVAGIASIAFCGCTE